MRGDAIRRTLDVAFSVTGLVLVSPLFLVVGALIKLDSPGPVFHVADRVGRGGRMFRLYKFRSMVAHAHRSGPGITAAGDRRITRSGRVLRRSKLDELPQLINVLKGDMSFVGPRPEDPRYVQLYTLAQRDVLRVRPGITGAASLEYRNEASLLTGEDWESRYVTEIMPHKLEMELQYLQNRSLAGDLSLALRTVAAVMHLGVSRPS